MNGFITLIQKRRALIRTSVLAGFFVILFFPLLTIKSCSYAGGASIKDPRAYSWIEVITRDGKFDPIAAVPPGCALMLIGMAFLRVKKNRVLSVYIPVAEYILAVTAAMVLLLVPPIAFLFDSVRYHALFFAAVVLILAAAAEGGITAFIRRRDIPPLSDAPIGIPRHVLRILNMAVMVPWLSIPFAGDHTNIGVGDILTASSYLVFLCIPMIIMQCTVNAALSRKEHWAVPASIGMTALSAALAVFMLTKLFH